MARLDTLKYMQRDSYTDTGAEKSIRITLGSAGVVTTVTLPDTAKGFRLYPVSNPGRFSVHYASETRDVAAIATSSSASIAANDLAVGGLMLADQWETRLLPPVKDGDPRKLELRSTTASLVVDLEIF